MRTPFRTRLLSLLCLLAVPFALTACRRSAETAATSTPPAATTPAQEPALADREAEVARKEKELADREATLHEAEIAARERDLDAREAALDQKPAAKPARPSSPRPSTPAPAPEPAYEPTPALPAPSDPEPAPAEPQDSRDEYPAEDEREPIRATVPAGTVLEVEFLDTVSTVASTVGDRFRARVPHDVVVGGEIAIPSGSRITGTVNEVKATRQIGGQARLALGFDRLELPGGETFSIQADFAALGKSETGKDAATIGGSAAGGAALGRILSGRGDRKRNTVLGALVGAAVGTAIASKTPGQEVEIAAGTTIDLRLEQAIPIIRR